MARRVGCTRFRIPRNREAHHIDDNTNITGNGVTGVGGGVYFYNDTKPVAEPVFYMGGGEISDNLSGGDGGGAYIKAGTLTGSLTALTGNTATGGIPGIAYKAGAPVPTITLPQNQQIVEED